jgi:hypothetical protein
MLPVNNTSDLSTLKTHIHAPKLFIQCMHLSELDFELQSRKKEIAEDLIFWRDFVASSPFAFSCRI